MPLSDDKALDDLFTLVRTTLDIAAKADSALGGKVDDIAAARQASQDAQVAARAALRAFLDRIGASSILSPLEQDEFTRIFGMRILRSIDPDDLAQLVKEKSVEVGLAALEAMAVAPQKL